MEEKLKVIRFIPSLVVKYVKSGNLRLVTSGCLYDTRKDANECFSNLYKEYSSGDDYSVVRGAIVTKVIEL